MNFRIISPVVHSTLDYAAAAALIVLPFALDLGAEAALSVWLSAGGGLGLILYSLMTDYRSARARLLSYAAHIRLDLAAAVVFLLAPFLFGWSGLTAAYYFVMGTGVLVVVVLSARPDRVRREPLGEHAG